MSEKSGKYSAVLKGSSRTADKFVARLPDGMRDALANSARNRHISMNARIVQFLEAGLANEDSDTPNHNGTRQWIPGVGQLIEVDGARAVIDGFQLDVKSNILVAYKTLHRPGAVMTAPLDEVKPITLS